MAEINLPANSAGTPGVRRSKKVGHYAIMDLTPEEKKAVVAKTGLVL